MYASISALATVLAVRSVTAYPDSLSGRKPSFEGNFTINQYQLYPENADFDFKSGKLYIGQLWNASLGIYDPYTKKNEVVEFPGISHNRALNMGGVNVDQRTGLVSLVANGPLEFPTNGADIAGDRWLISYDPKAKKEVYRVNLTQTSQGKYGGFQDMEQDPQGNTFVVGTFPGTLTKVSKDGKSVVPWYLPATINSTQRGLTGVAAHGWDLLAYGDASGQLWKFDMRAAKGVPTVVPVLGNHTFTASDAIYLPPRYGKKVLLVAESTVGTAVFYSADGWKSAQYKGTVALPKLAPGTTLVAPVQVGSGIYQVFMYFGDVGLGGQGTAGNRSAFPFYDISEEVDGLVADCEKERKVGREESPVEVASWYYKGQGGQVERRDDSLPEVASWYYKGEKEHVERRDDSPPEVASWYYKGQEERVERRDDSAPEVASWYYKGQKEQVERRDDSAPEVASWYYKSNGV